MSARRIFTVAQKKQVLAFAAEHGLTHAERTFDVSGSLICRWRRVLASRADALAGLYSPTWVPVRQATDIDQKIFDVIQHIRAQASKGAKA